MGVGGGVTGSGTIHGHWHMNHMSKGKSMTYGLQSRCLTPGLGCVWSAVAMLMLLSLCMALVGVESGAEVKEGLVKTGLSVTAGVKSQRSRRRLQRSVIQVGGGWRGLRSPYPRYHCGETDTTLWCGVMTADPPQGKYKNPKVQSYTLIPPEYFLNPTRYWATTVLIDNLSNFYTD